MGIHVDGAVALFTATGYQTAKSFFCWVQPDFAAVTAFPMTHECQTQGDKT